MWFGGSCRQGFRQNEDTLTNLAHAARGTLSILRTDHHYYPAISLWNRLRA